MSLVIPSKVERYVRDAAKTEARVAAIRMPGGDPAYPGCVIVLSAMGTAQLLELMLTAVKNAPDKATKEAWKVLGIQLSNAVLGEMQ